MKLTREEKIVVVITILSVLTQERAFDKLAVIEEVLVSDDLGDSFINEVGDVTGGDTKVAYDKLTKLCCKILEDLKGEEQ